LISIQSTIWVAEHLGSILDPATAKMVSEDFNADGTPSRTFYYDVPTEEAASGVHVRVTSGILTDQLESFSFVDKYTVESVLLASTIFPSGAAGLNYQENPRYLVLADVYVGESETPDGLSRLDVRVQGGGIKNEYVETAMQQNAEVAWYNDFNARRPYPGAGAFMAELPQTLLTEHGGTFTQDQLNDIVGRHMKMGGYPIVKTYGIDPTITEETVGSGYVTVNWPSYGSAVTYNVYISTSLNVGLIADNNAPIADVASGNQYTASGLTPSTKYYLKVGGIDDDDESFGPVVSATTTAVVA